MAKGSDREWVGAPLDMDHVSTDGIEKIAEEFDEGKEVLIPQLSERFGSYDLYETGHYVHSLSAHIVKGGGG